MGLINLPVPSLLQGMTQQAPGLRNPSQGDLQQNAVSHPVYGLGVRTGSDHVRKLAGLDGRNLFTSWILRDTIERYVVTFDGTSFRVFGLDGAEYRVTAAAGPINYLGTSSPKSDLVAMTIGDSTLILNRSKTVQMASSPVSAAVTPKVVVWVKQGNYSQKYSIDVNGTGAEVVTPDGVDTPSDDDDADPQAVEVTKIQTSYIASELANSLATGLGAGWTVDYAAGDSWFTVRKNDGSDFDITVRDSLAGNGLGMCKNLARVFDELPPIAPDGYKAKVLGNPGDSADDYWVVWSENRSGATDGGASRRGVWVETVAPNTQLSFDATTLPHRLDRLQDDDRGTVTGTPYAVYFQLVPIDWSDRLSGDTETIPNPSFVGKKIKAMFIFQGRLGFVFEDTLVMSRSQDLFNFWRESVVELVDSDPIDVNLAPGRLDDDKVLNIEAALSFNEELLLIADGAQITISGGDAVTPTNVLPKLSLNLECYTDCRPILNSGKAVIAFSDEIATGIYEITSDGSSRIKRERLVTRHVPRLIQGPPIAMTSCPNESTLFVQSSGAINRLYVLRTTDINNERAQEAWGFWDFNDKIVSFEVLDSTLWLIIERDEGLCLESVEITPYVQTEDSPFPILLDRKTPIGVARMRGRSGPPSGGGSNEGGGGGDGSGGGGGGGGGEEGGGGVTIVPSDVTPGGGGFGDFIQTVTGSANSAGISAGGASVRERGTISYNAATDLSTITLPWNATSTTVLVRADKMQEVVWDPSADTLDGDNVIQVRGDLTQVPLYAGEQIHFRYIMGPAVIQRQTPSGGTTIIGTGRLQVIRCHVYASNSGPFVLEVMDQSALQSAKVITPRTTGVFAADSPSDHSGSTLVRRRAEKCRVGISSTYWTPLWLIRAEYDAEYTRDNSPI